MKASRAALAGLVATAFATAGCAAGANRTLAVSCAGAARLRIHVGALPRGTEIEIRSASGELIGTVAPFALRAGQEAGTQEFRLDPALIQSGHLTVRLAAKHYGATERAPSGSEVRDMRVVCPQRQ